MTRIIVTHFVRVIILCPILYIAVQGAIEIFWPVEAVSSDIVSYPTATLSVVVLLLVLGRMVWEKQDSSLDTAMRDRIRQGYIGIFLFGIAVTILITAMMFYKEFLMTR